MAKRLSVKFWGGTHPDELLPLDIVNSLQIDPLDNVATGIVNTIAPRGTRKVNINMASAFPGDPRSIIPEVRRAVEVLRQSRGFDIVIDGHVAAHHVEHAWLNLSRPCSPQVFGFVAHLGIRHIVDTSNLSRNMIAHLDNAMMIEMGRGGKNHTVSRWRSVLRELVSGELPDAGPSDFEWYRLIGSASQDQRHEHSLPLRLGPFEPMDPEYGEIFGYPGQELHALSWDPHFPMWCGELAIKLHHSDLLLN